ncbi:hypothetical protein CSIRO_0754 [Bradyrhizobiaceae bacterium SG-6C]|nr:hypothetical protein CSIRO_0754 [Bradyrhizobiaceae bacterium SG-6C]
MTVQSDVSRGWSIAEAIERAALPDQWDEWIAAKAEWTKASTPMPAGPSTFITRSPREIERRRIAANVAFKKVRDNLWKLLEAERFVATGSREGPATQPSTIHSLAWKSLVWPRTENSIVRERYGAKAKIYNVRVFPLIYAPDAANRLNGLSLAEAFRRFVLDDPEVVALGERVMRNEGHERVFREGQAPGFFADFHWPLDASADDLAASLCQAPAFGPETPLRKPSIQVLAAAKALANRWSALRRSLVRGDVEALGTFAQTGVSAKISRTQWTRDGLLVHVRNSDLCEADEGKPITRWTGITLGINFGPSDNIAAPDFASHSSIASQTARELAVPKRRSAQRESIEQAVRAIWPNGVPKGIMAGKRNQQITNWQRQNRLVVPSDKTIDRYFREAKSRF